MLQDFNKEEIDRQECYFCNTEQFKFNKHGKDVQNFEKIFPYFLCPMYRRKFTVEVYARNIKAQNDE